MPIVCIALWFAPLLIATPMAIEESKKEQQINKLATCIEQIKEIAKKHKATAHCDYLTDMQQILQKISECEVK